MISDQELDAILTEEGFEAYPYQDHLGVWTIGHGLTFLTKQESRAVIQMFRLPQIERNLLDSIPWLVTQPPEVIKVCVHMTYQLGLRGFTQFKKFLAALQARDYATAADEMLDSQWATQTPARAKRLSDRVRAIS